METEHPNTEKRQNPNKNLVQKLRIQTEMSVWILNAYKVNTFGFWCSKMCPIPGPFGHQTVSDIPLF